MVEGLLASVAADRNESPGDLLRIWNLSALELPAYPALWGVCYLRFRNRGQRGAVLVPMAGERFSS